MKISDRQYHEIFLPLPDVYSEGGPEAITEFQRKDAKGRNLVILPLGFIERLGEMEDENSQGAAAALKYIKDIKDANGSRLSVSDKNSDRVAFYTVFDSSLDLCIIKSQQLSKEALNIATLEQKIHREWGLNAPIKIVTSKNAENIKHSLTHSSKGVSVEEPQFLIVDENIIHKGILFGNDDLYARLQESKTHSASVDEAKELLDISELYLNQFMRFNSGNGEFGYARVTGELQKNRDGSRILGVNNMTVQLIPRSEYDKRLHYGNRQSGHHISDNVLGIKPFDMEQYLAMQYGLLSPEVSLFFLCGKQGSGKTVLTYAAAIDSILHYDKDIRRLRGLKDEKGNLFEQIVLMKAPEILGGKRREVGHLPGDLFMKLKDHLAPYKDAHKETKLGSEVKFEDLFLHPKFETEFGGPRSKETTNAKINGGHLPSHHEAIELIYSGFAGGRSKRNTLFIVDEAQDYTPYEMKTILERLALGSAMVILGDPQQTRNPHCTVKKNGLTYAIRNYLGKPYAALVTLFKNYRGQISEDSEGMRVYNSR